MALTISAPQTSLFETRASSLVFYPWARELTKGRNFAGVVIQRWPLLLIVARTVRCYINLMTVAGIHTRGLDALAQSNPCKNKTKQTKPCLLCLNLYALPFNGTSTWAYLGVYEKTLMWPRTPQQFRVTFWLKYQIPFNLAQQMECFLNSL